MNVASPPCRRTFPTLVLTLFAAAAGAQSPSSEQLQIFQGLSPEQQQALLQQLGSGASASQTLGAQRASATNRAAQDASDAARRRALVAGEVVELAPVLKADDTLVIEISLGVVLADGRIAQSVNGIAPRQPTPAEEAARLRRERLVTALDPGARKKLEDLAALVLSRNPYQLDRNAALNLPGFAPIVLGGLTEEQATQRLSLDPVLLPLEVHLTRLPIAKTGIAGLKSFGYDLFDNAAATFSPVTDVPVPADYVMGPGDALNVQLYGGNQNRFVPLTVDRDGVVNFPELGPIRIGGMGFNAARRAIEARVTQGMIGVQASVSMGDTRGIRVFVLGEARLPGSYTVPGLATMTTALFASGGVKPIGSLRDIQLKRQGQIVRRFDLYDMLIRGDTSDDAKLQPGDVIFIPPVGSTISVDGEVKRPAIYELRDETSMADVVRMAGGYTAEADVTRANLTRIGADQTRSVLEVSLAQGSPGQPPRNGDVLRIGARRPQVDAVVTLDGFVYRPGLVAWREGLRLTDVLGSVDELRPNADQHYILIRRESGAARRISVVSADLAAALASPASAANVQLAPRDRVTVFDLGPGRERIIQPLMEELKLQSELADPTQFVSVGGKVKVPGDYPLETGMRVADLLRAGGNLDSSAFGGNAELTRYTVGPDGTRQNENIPVDLSAIRRGDAAANLQLRPFDYLMVKETPDWTNQEFVTLKGEVRFPGTYSISKGETVKQVLERAGGLNALAFPQGSAFTRQDLKQMEQQQLDRLGDRLRSDLASLALSAANAGQSEAAQSLQAGQSLLAQLQGARATGRFVIDLPGLLAGTKGGAKDVMLRNGDELVIPRQRQEVTVIGEVQNATSHLYLPQLKREQYIAASGGTTRKADKGRIYIVRADGNVVSKGGSLFARNYDSAVKPGDTIVVPLDTERMPILPFWRAVTQILYNVAVSVAAVNSF